MGRRHPGEQGPVRWRDAALIAVLELTDCGKAWDRVIAEKLAFIRSLL